MRRASTEEPQQAAGAAAAAGATRGSAGAVVEEVTQTESDRHTEGRGALREEVWSLFLQRGCSGLALSLSLARSLAHALPQNLMSHFLH